MGYGLVTIVKSYEGKEFANTHGIRMGGSDAAPLSNQDLADAGGGGIFTNATTDPADPGYLGATFILHAIIGYERSMLYDSVQFVRLEVTDGAPNDEGSTVFLSQTLSFAGLRTGAGGDANIAPGTITLQVNKEPATFSQRRGRHFFRGALLDAHVRIGGQTLVRFTDDDVIDAFVALLNGAVSLSSLSDFFAAGSQASTALYSIPRYGPKDSPTENQLVGTTPMSRFTIAKPSSRQANRGRRETSPTALARQALRRGNEAKLARILETAELVRAAQRDATARSAESA